MTEAWTWLSGPWAAALTMALLHFVWQGCLWALLGWTATRCWSSRSTNGRYAIWLTVLLAMAVSPAITLRWIAPQSSAVTDESTLTAMIDTELIAEPDSLTQKVSFSPVSVMTRIPATLSTEALQSWQPYLLLGWLVGALLSSLRVAVGAFWVVHATRSLAVWPENWQHAARRLARRLGLRSLPMLGLSDHVAAPMAVWFWRPVVILPASWLTETPADMIEAVIAHELSHIRRHDLWINLLQRVIETLLFFHPCVWWVSRQIRHERELCCDALAVTATGRAVEYARALEWVATWRLASAGPLLGTGLGGTRMVLLQRVKRVLGLESAAAGSGGWAWGAAGLAVLAVCAAGATLWTAPVQGEDETPSATAPINVEGTVEVVDDLITVEGTVELLDNALAQRDEERPPPLRRPEPPREGERRPDGSPREGERRPDAGPRDGERRPDDRPRDGERRPEGPRDGERRPEGAPRDGERRPEGGPRDGGPRPPFPPREGEFRPPVEAMNDMMHAIRELREEVRRLRAEVDELRNQRPPFVREGGPRPEFGPPGPRERGEGDRPRPPGEGRPGPRPETRDGAPRPRGEGDRPQPPGEGRERPRPEDGRRPEGRPEGERRPEPAPNRN